MILIKTFYYVVLIKLSSYRYFVLMNKFGTSMNDVGSLIQ